VERPAKILEQTWFSYKKRFWTCQVGEWECVWRAGRRHCLITPPSEFGLHFGKLNVPTVQKELRKCSSS